jgi:CubicO group peptidase (beta-lactamase class C family)
VALIKVDAEPGEVGFDASRLGRIDRHFRRYVDDGLLAGWTVAVTRRGRVAHLSHHGQRDLEAGLPVTDDTIWRIYSMTKPITSVAAMMLYEQGALELTDPVARFIPSFADARGLQRRAGARAVDASGRRAVRVWHLLTHTSGLTYGFHHAHPVDEMYRLRGFEYACPPGSTWPGVRPAGRAPAAVPAGHRVELRRLDRRARPVVEVASGSRSTRSSPSTSSARWAWTNRWWVASRTSTGWPTLYVRGPDGGSCRTRPSARR